MSLVYLELHRLQRRRRPSRALYGLMPGSKPRPSACLCLWVCLFIFLHVRTHQQQHHDAAFCCCCCFLACLSLSIHSFNNNNNNNMLSFTASARSAAAVVRRSVLPALCSKTTIRHATSKSFVSFSTEFT